MYWRVLFAERVEFEVVEEVDVDWGAKEEVRVCVLALVLVGWREVMVV